MFKNGKKEQKPKKEYSFYEVTWKKTGVEKEHTNEVFALDEAHAKRIIMQSFGKTYTFAEMYRRMENKQPVETGIEYISMKKLTKD